ncbi:MAG: hypothetical protein JXA18_06520 [Chitinispirillaceae bacterium]|nr:hypothetical protein [Chitinispirillaceae bacterium]
MKHFRLIIPATAAAALFSGCYTQFALIDRTPQPKEEVTWVVDSATGDTVKVIKQTDTVRTEEHQTCIWERDLLGYPRLYCYDSFYPRDWFYYNYSPWWYDYPYYYGGYYYGGRRYRGHYHEGDRGPVKTEPSGPGGSSRYPRARGIADPKSSGGEAGSSSAGATMPTGNEKSASIDAGSSGPGEIIIPAENSKKPVIVRERSRGVSEPGGAAPVPVQNAAPAPEPSKSAKVNQSAPPPPSPSAAPERSAQPSTGSSSPKQSSPPRKEGSSRPSRRKPRSW